MPSSASVAVPLKRDHLARPECHPSVGARIDTVGLVPALTVSGDEIVEFTPSDTVSRTW